MKSLRDMTLREFCKYWWAELERELRQLWDDLRAPFKEWI